MFDSSPGLIAACHVLHRLITPRHPPCTLSSLITFITDPKHRVRDKCPPPRADLRSQARFKPPSAQTAAQHVSVLRADLSVNLAACCPYAIVKEPRTSRRRSYRPRRVMIRSSVEPGTCTPAASATQAFFARAANFSLEWSAPPSRPARRPGPGRPGRAVPSRRPPQHPAEEDGDDRARIPLRRGFAG